MRRIWFLIIVCLPLILKGQAHKQAVIDSIINLNAKATNYNQDLEVCLNYALRANKLAKDIKVDSLIVQTNRNLSAAYLYLGDFENFKSINFSNLALAQNIGDSSTQAIAYNNLGYYYFRTNVQNDSAYYYFSKSVKLFAALKKYDSQAETLLYIANMQEKEKDYFGSEENAVRAINLLKTSRTEGDLFNVWQAYSLLGGIAIKRGMYDNAIAYHEKAQAIAEKMANGDRLGILAIHNMAFAYRKKRQYKKALELYNDVLALKAIYNEEDPTFYPLILDNIAYTKVVAGHTDFDTITKMFQKAYKISEAHNDPITTLAISIDIAKYYLKRNLKDTALVYAQQAYKIGKEIESNDILLESMDILAQLTDGEKGKDYLKEHIKLNDSLLAVERNVRNKFARIELETDQLIEENQRIIRERLWLFLLSSGLLLTVILIYIIVTQRTKNKQLQFKQAQQQANEEIYNLMLTQQDKIDEARANEKRRISQELHDGVLGRLFGTRLSLDSINFNEGKTAMLNRANYIAELKMIEDDIRKISHALNTDFLSGSGFMDIISELIQKQTTAYKIKATFNYDDAINWELLNNKDKINLYRIVQEALQNIYKHAQAKLVKVGFQLKNTVILLIIADDGKGFNIGKNAKGIGLKNINSRVKELGGKVTFESVIGKGTTVKIQIPYTLTNDTTN